MNVYISDGGATYSAKNLRLRTSQKKGHDNGSEPTARLHKYLPEIAAETDDLTSAGSLCDG